MHVKHSLTVQKISANVVTEEKLQSSTQEYNNTVCVIAEYFVSEELVGYAIKGQQCVYIKCRFSSCPMNKNTVQLGERFNYKKSSQREDSNQVM